MPTETFSSIFAVSEIIAESFIPKLLTEPVSNLCSNLTKAIYGSSTLIKVALISLVGSKFLLTIIIEAFVL